MYLLDTDTSVEFIRGNKAIVDRMNRERSDRVFITAIVHHELLYGALHSQAIKKHLQSIADFVEPLTILPFTSKTSAHSSEVKQSLTKAGTPIGALDILIAGGALEHGLILVTNNAREFSRVSGLQVESWN